MPLSKIQTGNLGRRNLLINGEFQIFQRATSATNPGGGYDTADRWRSSQNSGGLGNYTAEQSTDTPDGFGNSYKLTKSGATTISSGVSAYIQQYIEGQNVQHLNYGSSSAKKVTASFHVKSSVTGTYGVRLGDGEAGKHNVQTFTISSADTWEKKVVTFNGDTTTALANDNSAEFDFAIVLGAGSNYQTSSTNTWASGDKLSTSSQTQWPQTDGATFFMTGIQLEVADAATDFEHLSVAEELALCRRYFYRWNTDGEQYSNLCIGGVLNSSQARGVPQLPQTMRSNAAIAQSGDFRIVSMGSGAVRTSITISINRGHTLQPYVQFAGSGGSSLTVGQAAELGANASAAAYVDFDAEI